MPEEANDNVVYVRSDKDIETSFDPVTMEKTVRDRQWWAFTRVVGAYFESTQDAEKQLEGSACNAKFFQMDAGQLQTYRDVCARENLTKWDAAHATPCSSLNAHLLAGGFLGDLWATLKENMKLELAAHEIISDAELHEVLLNMNQMENKFLSESTVKFHDWSKFPKILARLIDPDTAKARYSVDGLVRDFEATPQVE